MTGDPKLTDEARRRKAVALAGHRGDRDEARAALRDPSAAVRATALGSLARLGELDADDVRAALADDDPRLRRRACELAARLPDVDLVPLLEDGDANVVEAAAWALGEREAGDDRTVDALAAVATKHREPLCREAAVAALGAVGEPRGLPAVLAGCEDKPAVRRRAVLALAPFEGPEVAAALQRALEDRDWQVRQAAEDLLGRGPSTGPADSAGPVLGS